MEQPHPLLTDRAQHLSQFHGGADRRGDFDHGPLEVLLLALLLVEMGVLDRHGDLAHHRLSQ